MLAISGWRLEELDQGGGRPLEQLDRTKYCRHRPPERHPTRLLKHVSIFSVKNEQKLEAKFFKVRNLSIHTRSYCQRVEHRRELEKGEAERRIVRKIGYLLHLCALLLAQVKTSPHLSFRHWQVTYSRKGRRRKEAPPPFPFPRSFEGGFRL